MDSFPPPSCSNRPPPPPALKPGQPQLPVQMWERRRGKVQQGMRAWNRKGAPQRMEHKRKSRHSEREEDGEMSRGCLNLFPGSLSEIRTWNGKVSLWLPINLWTVPNKRINDTRLCLLWIVIAIKSDLMISVDWNMSYPRECRLGIVVSIQLFLLACAGPSRPVLIYEHPLSSHSILEGLSD